MWHASVSLHRALGPVPVREWTMNDCKKADGIIDRLLRGVGNRAHQWREMGEIALHHRRRATADESSLVGGVTDAR